MDQVFGTNRQRRLAVPQCAVRHGKVDRLTTLSSPPGFCDSHQYLSSPYPRVARQPPMRPVRLLVVLIPLVVACSENDNLGLGLDSGERFTAAMNGANVRPVSVGTPATATASITVKEPSI